jgi:subfamily B ATP-binding cassette protein MsbA
VLTKELKTIRFLWPFMRPYVPPMTVIVVLSFLEALAELLGISLLIPLLSTVDELAVSPQSGGWLGGILEQIFTPLASSQRITVIATLIFCSILLRSLLGYSRAILGARTDSNLDHDLRMRVIDQYLHLGLREAEGSEPGRMLNTLEEVVSTTSQAMWVLVDLIIGIGTTLVFVGFLLLLSWKLTLLVGVALVLISIVVKLITQRVETRSRRALEAHQQMAQSALETLRGVRTIRTFGQEDFEERGFSRVSQSVARSNFELQKISALISPTAQVLAGMLLVAVLLIALQSPANLPAILVFVFILYRLQPHVLGLDESRNGLLMAGPYVEKFVALLEESRRDEVQSGTVVLTGHQDSIRFDKVSFRYAPEEPWALEDISFEIPQGSTIALVGPSGAGKSTLISLLLRLYDPGSGVIEIDGNPLRRLDLPSWRSLIAVAGQDTFIFNTTIRNNIAYGRLGVTEEEVESAARQADAHQFISAIPTGYDTVVGDMGIRLSGGQRQRISLARAIIRRADILVLDEAVNALDGISEKVIQESVQTQGQGRTVIIIAHRLSTIEMADQIIVLEAGRVQEQGPADELLRNRALFSRLYELQRRGPIGAG